MWKKVTLVVALAAFMSPALAVAGSPRGAGTKFTGDALHPKKHPKKQFPGDTFHPKKQFPGDTFHPKKHPKKQFPGDTFHPTRGSYHGASNREDKRNSKHYRR